MKLRMIVFWGGDVVPARSLAYGRQSGNNCPNRRHRAVREPTPDRLDAELRLHAIELNYFTSSEPKEF
jgi:hypothetical protein